MSLHLHCQTHTRWAIWGSSIRTWSSCKCPGQNLGRKNKPASVRNSSLTWMAVIKPDGGLLWGGLARFAVGWVSFSVSNTTPSNLSVSFTSGATPSLALMKIRGHTSWYSCVFLTVKSLSSSLKMCECSFRFPFLWDGCRCSAWHLWFAEVQHPDTSLIAGIQLHTTYF